MYKLDKKTYIKLTTNILTLLFMTITFTAFYVKADSVDDFVKSEMEKRNIPGLQLAIIQNDKITKEASYGYANLEDDIKVENSNFLKAIWTILLADFTMSLDNVLGVAGAAGDHYLLLIFGLVLSIILMATAANLISKWIKEYKWIAWAGLLAILIVAIELIYTDIKILFL